MAQAYRDQYAHYIDTAPTATTPTWVREGTGVDALAIAYNAQKDTYKTIKDRNAMTTFNSYQMTSSINGKRIYVDDPLYDYLNDARLHATALETHYLEVDTADEVTTGNYRTIQYDILITINEWLGENATISYDIDFQGSPVQGTATITGGTPTFTPSVSL